MRAIQTMLMLLPFVAGNSLPSEVQVVDHLAIVLTGQFPNTELRTAYVNKEKTLLEIAEELRDSDEFERKLAYFFQEKLRITEPLEFVDTYSHPIETDGETNYEKELFNNRLVVGGRHYVFNIKTDTTDEKIAKFGEQIEDPRAFNREENDFLSKHLNFREGTYTMVLFQGAKTSKDIIVDGATAGNEVYKKLQNLLWRAHYCFHSEAPASAQPIMVRPYWDMTQQVKACPAVVEERFCGENMRHCFPYAMKDTNLDPANMYRIKIAEAMTLEPGIIMAKTVREGKKYSTVLTTSMGVVNGHYLHYLQNFDRTVSITYRREQERTARGSTRLTPTPNVLNSYPNLNDFVVSTATSVASGEISLHDPTFRWIDRGGKDHAGVLTTFAFHRATNGRRAKANKARSALLCREFTDPPGAKPDPSDKRELAERAYCGGCHKYLEPFAKFFHRWPETGNDNNYYFDFYKEDVNTEYFDTKCTSCAKVSGEGAKGLAQILVAYEDDGFKDCALRHAFEFIIGRGMNDTEYKDVMPKLREIYDKEGENLWKVMRDLIDSKTFKEVLDASSS